MSTGKTEEQWREELTPEQFSICRGKGTERAFTGKYWDCHDDGTYHCIVCDAQLFSSDTKFESGTGWPSFTAPVDPAHVLAITDRSHGMTRTETRCARCDSHQGHVFPDGPGPGGLRYCINSVALTFVAEGGALPDPLGRGDGMA